MFATRNVVMVIASLAILCFPAASAVADWNEGDGHKQHDMPHIVSECLQHCIPAPYLIISHIENKI